MLFHRTLLPSFLPLLSTTTPSLFFPSQLSSPPLPSPPPCSRLPSPLLLSVPAADVSQVREKKREMDILGTSSALRSNPYFDMTQSPLHIFHADNQHHYQNSGNGYNQGTHQQCEDVWGLDRSMTHVAGEDFSIEELLNLGGLPEEALDQQQPLLLEKLGEEEDDDEKMDLEEDQVSDSSSGPCFKDSNPSELIVPVGDISDLEWVSKIVDDSDLPCSVVSPVYLPLSTSNYSRSPSSGSMTSVSTSSKRTIASFSDKTLYVPSKSRTKRARTGGQGWLLHHPLLADPICSSSVSSSTSVSSTSSLSSHLLLEPQTLNPIVVRRGRGRPPLHKKKDEPNTQQQTQTKQKKKGRKPKFVPTAAELPETTRNADVGANGRCCSHCGVQKTPQWRAGPMGSKTLCNACGVRYKSGRLLPEYRPAISPTFLDHVHSNSHRKVLEMRRQKESQLQNQLLISGSDSTSDTPVCPPPETIPVIQHLVF